MNKKISLEKVNYFLKNYYRWILGIIFVLLFCLNILIYYQYVYLTMKAEPEPTLEKITIDQEGLKKILDNLDKRQENLERVEKTNYSDPFR
ncbi:MAG: hypothetical protein COX44_00390 [Candidatus Portnoybacteria bacterium CG23_combo_of_CG06-09_8_20_14_all_37_13]|uniref:Uncharacterized protein n=2 Tax=Candidatus Portnoyibacteriota TaxID=1817913 RepID=A0A2M7BU66_9BACT|nr:MAG: hypothetical protein COX44_00390 [Candidatus Portnoybacteria bacterium CG23_combo_of_CG06-09_8_20_14_all_37_13]PIV10098.1 MAG: hypothetical protein COS49_02345 [Candidatus Portnoybacteria bacterium CG03_land_8_20_14_0_80_41_10]